MPKVEDFRPDVLVDLLEIDISFFHIRMDELHLKPVAHIDAFIPVE